MSTTWRSSGCRWGLWPFTLLANRDGAMPADGQERSSVKDRYQVGCVPTDLPGLVVIRTKSAFRFLFYLLAGVLLLFACWCLLWVLSSSSMAFTECNGAYELLSSKARCRQPAIAGLLALASLLGAALAAFIGWRFGR